jgi:hypothetical protein
MSGLFVMSRVIGCYVPRNTRLDLVSWFCSALRENSNNMRHYLSNIEGCGNHLELYISKRFFEIFKIILTRLACTHD